MKQCPSIPIYVLFFVLVGARFNFSGILPLIWGIAGVYVLGRSVGKFFGTRLGAKMSAADGRLEKFTGTKMPLALLIDNPNVTIA